MSASAASHGGAPAVGGELAAEADPDRLALALLAAVQGGLLLTQVRRESTPLEVALDTMLEHIALLVRSG
jgi:TetR/AcrR family transcriptional regulator, transcriptional repressor for nem operon